MSAGYSSWAPGEPDDQLNSQDCALLHEQNYWSWKDYFCSVEEYSYVCQRGMQNLMIQSKSQVVL